MFSTKDEFRHCPHCGQLTRHSIVRERVLAPVLWCLGCFHTRIGDDPPVQGHAMAAPLSSADAGQAYRLAG
ncbi:hypothetical protein A6A04_12730 [Paramagnetospirillum marisnigri]|uniref:Uncharacterized protein n=1 Tax=Paramagnetospirillum marisnigri TaxID=1285242 RepID=A0A178MVC2_9PROT|nr:hypothetical protein [Paramagnetospirillum marisnigri]OAN54102.1 hypothetical protein A6A04_12730 [Paramagnetospirillum marisnigri]